MKNNSNKKKEIHKDKEKEKLRKRVDRILFEPPLQSYIETLAKQKQSQTEYASEPYQDDTEPYQADPEQYQADPEPYQAEPEPYQAEPEQYQADPEQYQADPEQYQADPEPYQAEPEPYQAEPEPYQAEPEPYQAEPEQYQAEPEQYQADPEQYQADPEQYQADPDPYQAPYQADPDPYQAPYQAEPEPYQADTEPYQAESTYTEPYQAESTYTEPYQAESTYTEPYKAESNYTESYKAESNYTEPYKAESTYTEPYKAESNYTEPYQTESNYTEPYQTESNYTEPYQDKVNQTGSEQTNSYPPPTTEATSGSHPITEEYVPEPETDPPYEAYKEDHDTGKVFDETVLSKPNKYLYEEDEPSATEFYSSRRFEDFILSKGFLILEYFVQGKLCSFIMIQLPMISETVMIFVNRKKYPIDVSTSSYKKTMIEKIKLDHIPEERLDYDNIALDGFDINHSLDVINDTNIKQKSLSHYLTRQLSRLMYITKNIEIKPCILLDHLFGYHDLYHMIDRPSSKEFYPIISIEILFSKTFILEQNLPVFYKKFYSIVNQSNINKMNSLEMSLVKLMDDIKKIKTKLMNHMTLETDQLRIKTILTKLKENDKAIAIERAKPQRVYDPIQLSYVTKKFDQEQMENNHKRTECNKIYMEIKKEYDQFVLNNEISFYELYNKVQDIEELFQYLYKK